jgi:hypothetical protein
MTIANILRRKLAEAAPASGRHELLFTEESCPWTIHLTAERHDEWSTVAWELSLRRGTSFDGDLADWAERVANNVSGLMESIKVVEVDRVRNEALLRSIQPESRDGQLFYYEFVLHGTSAATLRRFQAWPEPGHKRTQVPFALTNEALGKLVGDLSAEK